MSLKLNSVGGGSVTLQEPSTASNFTVDLPAASGTLATTAGVVSSLNGATGAITNNNAYDIGSYILGRPANTTSYVINNTVAGSILYVTTARGYYGCGWCAGGGPQQLVNVGTWRCMALTGANSSAIWIRIS
jgi:hypothetical protein